MTIKRTRKQAIANAAREWVNWEEEGARIKDEDFRRLSGMHNVGSNGEGWAPRAFDRDLRKAIELEREQRETYRQLEAELN